MAVNSYDAVAEKILTDLESVFKKDVSIVEFEVIPTTEAENRNSSPVLKGEGTLGLESWIIPHIYPYAHHQIMQKNNFKMQNLEKLMPCLLGVALLNPDMPAAWSFRRELIKARKLQTDNELRLTTLALSRKPKSNEALAHRRWIITEILKDVGNDANLLKEELKLAEMIANRYHSNYHAWSHRMWSLQHLIPGSSQRNFKKKLYRNQTMENTSMDASKLKTVVFSMEEYCSIVNTESFQIYSEELEHNFKWISSHVSDHSGLHYRKFLLSEIAECFKSSVSLTQKFEDVTDTYPENSSNFNLATVFYNNRRSSILEYFKSFEFGNHYKIVVQNYLEYLERELTLFDVLMSLVIAEFKSNCSLSLMFPGHEASWYYRRFLIFFSKQVLDGYDSHECLNEYRIGSHQDKNGVPHRKDFKYDNVKSKEETNVKHSDLYALFYQRILKNEENIILTSLNSSDEHIKMLAKNYSNWLKHFWILDDKSFN